VQRLPLADPGLPDLRSAPRVLAGVGWLQRWTVLGGMVFGVLWMISQALVPYVLGRVVDDGIAARNADGLRRWVLVLVALAVVQGWAQVTRHRFAVANWIVAAFRTTQWVSGQTLRRLGASLPSWTSTGGGLALSPAQDQQVALARLVLADRVAVVEDGRVTELGGHDELLALGGSYAALWRSRQSA
jgi:ABC-type multidrug transport system fused ATPase/permease subunit